MNTITIATFNDKEQAEPLRRRLEVAGIHATIADQRRLQKYWFMSEPLAGIKLNVDKPDFAAARKLLHDWDAQDGALRDAIHCPQCRLSRIEYPQLTQKFSTPAVVGILFVLRLIQRRFYCQDCQFTWPVNERLDVDRDILGWPKESNTADHTDENSQGIQRPAPTRWIGHDRSTDRASRNPAGLGRSRQRELLKRGDESNSNFTQTLENNFEDRKDFSSNPVCSPGRHASTQATVQEYFRRYLRAVQFRPILKTARFKKYPLDAFRKYAMFPRFSR